MDDLVQTVRVRDIDVHVVRVGQGSPLVISGGPQLGHAYLRAFDALADVHELIYFDARGTGRTDLGDPSQLTLAGAIADLVGVCDALGIERFSILGHSLGGHVAYLVAAAHPARVQSLVLVDVGPPITRELAVGLSRAMRAQRTAEDDADLERIGASPAFEAREPKAMEALILNIYAPFFRDRRTIPTVDLGFTELTAANVTDYEERLVATLPAQEPLERLAEITCPTLVVHGEADPIPLASSELLADRIPGAQLAVIPGGGHFPFIEDQDAFFRVTREFLASDEARGAPVAD
jgi:proline iminopeptidase